MPETASDEPIDLGHGHILTWWGWSPERDVNPQYEGIPDDPHAFAEIVHPRPDGTGTCVSGITPDTAPAPMRPGNRPTWRVESFDPLTVWPSILCRVCGDHGFIRDGAWVPA